MSISAPQVIALRGARLDDQKELLRMWTEKVGAFQEAATAIGFQIFRSSVEWALLPMRQWWLFWQNPWRWVPFGMIPSRRMTQRMLGRSAAAVIDKGLAPSHRRVTRNLQRLGRPKKR
jgi:hypothetical protein